jgi:hypothetical protein
MKVLGVTMKVLAPGACCCARSGGLNGKPVGEVPGREMSRSGP